MEASRFKKKIHDVLLHLLQLNALSVPANIEALLKEKLGEERGAGSEIAVQQIGLILDNFKYAAEKKLPACQDTGMINIFIYYSDKVKFPADFKNVIDQTVSEATNSIPLRPNTVDPFTGKNHGDNLGHNTPPVYYEFDPTIDYIKIIVLNKGGGAENMSKLLMLNASIELEDIEKEILKMVKQAGGKPCPPIILGIGIGGDALNCMYLAKKALSRPLFDRNPRKEARELEERLLHKINELNVGVMGLGGSTTCLDVRVEYAFRHPASFPVGVIFQCYSHRISSAELDANLEVEYRHE